MTRSQAAMGGGGRLRWWWLGLVVAAVVVAIWYVAGDQSRRAAIGALDGALYLAVLGASTIGSLLISGSWASLHTGVRMVPAWRRYLLFQPAKYVPGGFAQGLLQVSESRQAEGSWGVASLRYVSHLVTVVVAGLLVGAPAILRFLADASLLVLWSVAAALVLAVVGLIRFGRARLRSLLLELRGERRLPMRAYVVGVGTACMGLFVWGLGYALTVEAMDAASGFAGSVSGFAASWMLGFLAVPVPAGVGVREGFLVALTGVPAEIAITASLVVRVAVLMAEVGLSLIALAFESRATFRERVP